MTTFGSTTAPSSSGVSSLCVQTPGSAQPLFGNLSSTTGQAVGQLSVQPSGNATFDQSNNGNKPFGALGNPAFGQTSAARSQNFAGQGFFNNHCSGGFRSNGFYFGTNHRQIKNDATTQTSQNDIALDKEQAQAHRIHVENNQLFGKILENELYNIPIHLKLDCMQEMLEVIKKYTPRKTV